jgi:hypothetical protein
MTTTAENRTMIAPPARTELPPFRNARVLDQGGNTNSCVLFLKFRRSDSSVPCSFANYGLLVIAWVQRLVRVG